MVKMNPDVIPTTEKVEQLTLNPLSNCVVGGDVLPSSSSNNTASTDFDRKVTSPLSPSKDYGPNVKILKSNGNIRDMQTVLRDKTTNMGDFKFYADRLIRLVVEEGLNQLPYTPCEVTTPTGHRYEGLKYIHGNCGVSIMRSGEAMEQGLRDVCRSIRIGKILIQTQEETQEPKVFYAKFPPDVEQRRVLLMYPIMSTGQTVAKAIRVLMEHRIKTENIILLNLFATPNGVQTVTKQFPDLKILTSEIHSVAPNHFGQKYFGTD